jgi:hypothetical protein
MFDRLIGLLLILGGLAVTVAAVTGGRLMLPEAAGGCLVVFCGGRLLLRGEI